MPRDVLVSEAINTALNVVVLAGIPFFGYYLYHRWRWKRGLAEVARRAGLQGLELRYLAYSLVFTAVVLALLLVWPPDLQALGRESSPQHIFVGLDLGPAVVMALLYGVVKTGFSEELLFRGLIAGSLSRRLSLGWANFWQAVIFILPHLTLAFLAPELRGYLVVIFAGAFFVGWLRIKSGSILGPWLIHATLNTAVCLFVALRT